MTGKPQNPGLTYLPTSTVLHKTSPSHNPLPAFHPAAPATIIKIVQSSW